MHEYIMKGSACTDKSRRKRWMSSILCGWYCSTDPYKHVILSRPQPEDGLSIVANSHEIPVSLTNFGVKIQELTNYEFFNKSPEISERLTEIILYLLLYAQYMGGFLRN